MKFPCGHGTSTYRHTLQAASKTSQCDMWHSHKGYHLAALDSALGHIRTEECFGRLSQWCIPGDSMLAEGKIPLEGQKKKEIYSS